MNQKPSKKSPMPLILAAGAATGGVYVINKKLNIAELAASAKGKTSSIKKKPCIEKESFTKVKNTAKNIFSGNTNSMSCSFSDEYKDARNHLESQFNSCESAYREMKQLEQQMEPAHTILHLFAGKDKIRNQIIDFIDFSSEPPKPDDEIELYRREGVSNYLRDIIRNIQALCNVEWPQSERDLPESQNLRMEIIQNLLDEKSNLYCFCKAYRKVKIQNEEYYSEEIYHHLKDGRCTEKILQYAQELDDVEESKLKPRIESGRAEIARAKTLQSVFSENLNEIESRVSELSDEKGWTLDTLYSRFSELSEMLKDILKKCGE